MVARVFFGGVKLIVKLLDLMELYFLLVVLSDELVKLFLAPLDPGLLPLVHQGFPPEDPIVLSLLELLAYRLVLCQVYLVYPCRTRTP